MTSQSSLDLTAARARASFSPDRLNLVLNEGGRIDGKSRSEIAHIISQDAVFDKSQKSYMSRAQRLERGLAISKRLFEQVDKNDWDYMQYLEALACVDEPIGLYLHEVAFQPVISAQASDEQQQIWLPKCYNHEIIGCYLQTELGHGSNVQQLETTATYDSKSEEFVINSPTVSATKWWIGALGLLATHGVVQARLILDGKELGPHLFIVQLRSLSDHSLLPNIQAGEIGPKVLGVMPAVDNGWARFNNLRIPRDQMLSRFAQVSAAGAYTRPPHDKLSYGGMIFIRAQMIGNLAWKLAKAVTISTRYLHVRRQFADPDLKRGEKGFGVERQVISYPSVYMRIIPQIAKSIVFITAGKDMSNLYESMAALLAGGDTTLLAETHAVSSGLKSYVSAGVVEGIEIVRRAMGGHGVLDSAGVGRIYAAELPSTTYEGDNYILNLQVARAALKTLNAFRTNPKVELAPSSAYFASLQNLNNLPLKSIDWLNSSTQTEIISLRAGLLVNRLDRLLKSGKSFGDLSWECVQVSRAVVEAFLVRRMLEAVNNENEGLLAKGVEANEKKVLKTLIQFYILYTIETAVPDLLEFGIIAPSPVQTNEFAGPVETLRAELARLAKALLPELVCLVDSFKLSDFELDTTVGNYDGRSYETMLERAQADMNANAGNEQERQRIYREHIKPILTRGERLSKL